VNFSYQFFEDFKVQVVQLCIFEVEHSHDHSKDETELVQRVHEEVGQGIHVVHCMRRLQAGIAESEASREPQGVLQLIHGPLVCYNPLKDDGEPDVTQHGRYEVPVRHTPTPGGVVRVP